MGAFQEKKKWGKGPEIYIKVQNIGKVEALYVQSIVN